MPTASLLAPREGLAALHRHGLATGIDDALWHELATQTSSLLGVLQAYYRTHPVAALSDGFVRVFIDADDPVGQLASAVGGEPLVVTLADDDDEDILAVRTARGQVVRFDFFEPHSLADLAKLFNEELAHIEDPRRFFVIAHANENAFAFFLLPVATAQAIGDTRALAIERCPT